MKCTAWIRRSHFPNACFLPNSCFQRVSSGPCWSVIETFCYHFLLCCFVMKILPSLCCTFLLISLCVRFCHSFRWNRIAVWDWSVRTFKRSMGKPAAFSKAKNVPSLPPLTLSLWTLYVQHSWKMWGEKGALDQPHINLKLSGIPQSITDSISAVCQFFC